MFGAMNGDSLRETEDVPRTHVAGAEHLSPIQRERIHRNRERAKAIRRARTAAAPYDTGQRAHSKNTDALVTAPGSCVGESILNSAGRLSGTVQASSAASYDVEGGFLLDEEEAEWSKRSHLVEEKAPALLDEQVICDECGKPFAVSHLLDKFNFSVCDNCRDPKGKHALITKTEAKQKYLLKDCDFGERGGPALAFILKRNPHSSQWGDMYLYLEAQVEARSHQVWEGEGGLEAAHSRKKEAREKKKGKKYAQEIKQLRKAVRSSIMRSTPRSHEHSYAPEIYSPDDDVWTKTCTECGHQISYEKM